MISRKNIVNENAFSMLEISVAVGVAALLSTAAVVASTTFLNDSKQKTEDYIINANASIQNAEEKYNGITNPFISMAYQDIINGTINFDDSETGAVFMPTGADFSEATFTIIEGELPEGVTLDPSTGAIYGPTDWGYDISALGNVQAEAVVEGSTVTGGVFESSISYDGMSANSAGATDIVVLKTDDYGDTLWMVTAGGSGVEQLNGMAAMSDGSVIIVGSFENEATFGGDTLTSAGGSDIFVAKIDTDGSFMWATRAGGAGSESAESVVVNSSDEIIISGTFTDSIQLGGANLTSSGESDVFVAQLSSSGSFDWASKLGGEGIETASDVTVLNDGTILVTGSAPYTPEAEVTIVAVEVNDLTRPITEQVESGTYEQKTVLDMNSPIYDSFERIVKITRNEPYQVAYTYGCGYKYRGTCTGYNTYYHDVDYWEPEMVDLVVGYNTKEVDDLTRPIMEDSPTGEYYQKTRYKACVGEGEAQQCSALFDESEGIQEVTVGDLTVRVASEQVDDLTNPIMTVGLTGEYGLTNVDDTTQPVYRDELIWEYESYLYEWLEPYTYGCGYKNRGTCTGYTPMSETRWHWVQNPLSTLIGYEQKMVEDPTQPLTGEVESGAYEQKLVADFSEDVDMLIAKIDTDGSTLWSMTDGGMGSEMGSTVVPTSDGGALISGTFEGSIVLGDTTLTSNGETDVFVAKINSSGEYQWAESFGGSGGETVGELAADGSNGAVVAGSFENTMNVNGSLLASSGGADVYAVKFDSTGSIDWARRGGGSGNDYATGVVVKEDGSTNITGTFEGMAVFGANVFTSTASEGYTSFTAKINDDGTWAPAQIERSTQEVAIQASDGVNSAFLELTISTERQ